VALAGSRHLDTGDQGLDDLALGPAVVQALNPLQPLCQLPQVGSKLDHLGRRHYAGFVQGMWRGAVRLDGDDSDAASTNQRAVMWAIDAPYRTKIAVGHCCPI
jgi:hypothetical protein